MAEQLKDILDRINRTWFLPTLQRDYVWLKNEKNQKVEKLFDSLMLGYPIGQIVLWKTNKETKGLTVYKFLDHYNTDGDNETGGISVGRSKVEYLVLDGQQRLTSLYVSLNPSGYIQDGKNKKYLYINLLHSEDKQLVDDITYEFEFKTEKDAKKMDEKNLWFRVSEIMDTGRIVEPTDYAEEYIEELRKNNKIEEILTKNERKIKNTLMKMWSNIRQKEINFEKVENPDVDKILEIFVRLNDGGMTLEKSDLLLSFMESKNNLFGSNGARSEITDFVNNQINKRDCGIEAKVKLEKDLILKACLMLSDLPVAYKLKSFNNENLEKIAKEWPKVKKTMTIVYSLLDKYNFTDNTVIAKNALLPIAYYLREKKLDKPVFVNSKDKSDIKERRLIIEWLAKVLISGAFGGSSDTTLTNYRDDIKKNKKLSFIGAKKLLKRDIETRVKKAEYKGKYTQLILFLTTDSKYWETSQDHIFAQKKFKTQPLQKYKKYMNRVANLQLLSVPENASKNDSDILPWLKKHEKELIATNLYPTNVKISDLNFEKFFAEREKLIIDRLCNIFEIIE